MPGGTPERLSPVIGLTRLVGLTFAVIAPASSVFLTYGTAFQTAGPTLVFSYGIGALINLAIMFCYAELGSRFPEAGGDYALAARALGRWAGSLYTVLFAVKGIAIPALLALSTAAYIHQLWPGLPMAAGAMGIFVLFLALAGLDIRTSSAVVTLMVAVEFAVFVLFTTIAASHLHRGPGIFWQSRPHALDRSWLAAIPAALYGLNGPQSSLYYSEETRVSPRQVGRTIFGTAVVTVSIELLGVVLGTLALPRLEAAPSTLPLAHLMEASLGPTVGVLIIAGIAVALFDTGVATTMSYARIFYAIARDRQWPQGLNRIMTYVSHRGVPLGALAILGALNLTVLALSGIDLLVTMGGTLLIVVYLGIIAGTFLMRLKRPTAPYAMPLWPWPAIAALAGLFVSVVELKSGHLALTAFVVLLGLAWSLVSPARPDSVG